MTCVVVDRITERTRLSKRVDSPDTPALTKGSCRECGYPTQDDFVLCPRCGTDYVTPRVCSLGEDSPLGHRVVRRNEQFESE